MVRCKTMPDGNKICCVPYTRWNCYNVTQANVENRWREYYKKYDLIQTPIATNYWYNNIPKIPKEQIPEYEKRYIINYEQYLGVPFLVLRERSTAF